jgi:hypothetical protein
MRSRCIRANKPFCGHLGGFRDLGRHSQKQRLFDFQSTRICLSSGILELGLRTVCRLGRQFQGAVCWPMWLSHAWNSALMPEVKSYATTCFAISAAPDGHISFPDPVYTCPPFTRFLSFQPHGIAQAEATSHVRVEDKPSGTCVTAGVDVPERQLRGSSHSLSMNICSAALRPAEEAE